MFETGGVDLGTGAARNYRVLRSRGCTVRKTIDCLIATFCLLGGHTLRHRDRDFDAVEGAAHTTAGPTWCRSLERGMAPYGSRAR